MGRRAREVTILRHGDKATGLAVFVLALCLLGASAPETRGAAAVKDSFKPVRKTQKKLIFRLRGIEHARVLHAKVRMRPAQGRRRGRAVRRLSTRRVGRVARNGARLRLRKPRWVKSGKIKVVTEPGPGVVSGTGAVLAEDLATRANPCLVWGAIMSPFLQGCDGRGSSDPYVVRRSGDGDRLPPLGDAPHGSYRRYTSKAGVQSIYDSDVAHNDATRTQTQHWSSSSNPMSFGPGRYAFYLSFRLQSPSPFPYKQANGGGIAKYSQLLQFKSFGGGRSTHLPLSATIGSDGIKFVARRGGSILQDIIRLQPGRWIRLAVVADWDSRGWYEVWGDLDGSGEMTRLIGRQTGIDFMQGRRASAMGIGLYHQLSLFDGSVAGQPRQETVYTDYANIQMARYW